MFGSWAPARAHPRRLYNDAQNVRRDQKNAFGDTLVSVSAAVITATLRAGARVVSLLLQRGVYEITPITAALFHTLLNKI